MKKTRKSNNEKALEQVRHFQRFDKHVITREGHGVWYCGEPGTGIYHFRVIMVPGRIIVTGDIGDMILHVNHAKPLRWALGCKMTPEGTYYPLSKLAPEFRESEFQPDDATEWLNDQISEHRRWGDRETVRKLIKMAKAWKGCYYKDELDRAEHFWHEMLYEHGEEPIGFRDYEFGIYFRYQALCWFMQHVNPKDDRFKAELRL